MSGPIRYDFAGLDAGHSSMMGGASGFTDQKDQWKGVVTATVMTWMSQDGQDFGDVNQMFDQAVITTNDFLTRLATAVQQCNMNAQDTLAYCRGVVAG